jgi:predicted dehydrogenase
MRTLNTAVIGVGHLGQHHARIYHELDGSNLLAIVDSNADRAKEIADPLGVPTFTDPAALLDLELDAISVAVPTVAHHAVAMPFLEKGIATLIEKPLAHTLDEAHALTNAAAEHGATLQVGHVERFNPAVMAIQEGVNEPKFIECHRLSALSFRSVDIDVVMDVMIHDIDIILHLVNSPVKQVDATGVQVLLNSEDIANARLQFENGCVANVTASRVSDKVMRKIRIFSRDGYTSLDYADKDVKVIQRRDNFEMRVMKLMMDPESKNRPMEALVNELIEIRDIHIEDHEPLKEELRSFLDAVRNETTPLVPGEHGVRAMEVAQQILESIRENRG